MLLVVEVGGWSRRPGSERSLRLGCCPFAWFSWDSCLFAAGHIVAEAVLLQLGDMLKKGTVLSAAWVIQDCTDCHGLDLLMQKVVGGIFPFSTTSS